MNLADPAGSMARLATKAEIPCASVWLRSRGSEIYSISPVRIGNGYCPVVEHRRLVFLAFANHVPDVTA